MPFFGKFDSKISNLLKDTHRKKAPSNKTPMILKGINVNIWVVGTSNQLFIRGSETEAKFLKNKAVNGKTLFFAIDPF